jgi:hypothetical protein
MAKVHKTFKHDGKSNRRFGVHQIEAAQRLGAP